jgi:hypothetical protein
MAIFLRLSVLFKLNDRLNLVFTTLNRTVAEIFSFIITLTPTVLGFALAF